MGFNPRSSTGDTQDSKSRSDDSCLLARRRTIPRFKFRTMGFQARRNEITPGSKPLLDRRPLSGAT
ncbi:hypothetical protein RISK_004919 [Rhodopirellula islandica]|uniref:Uncharacterized protein n=1 Tax=Rhodopirellula islandica TaxID=595434 RepID=A0A0J1EBN6_RHOIS|nr:hypothetical protein RISK_004919 [Rhodopirellula islandica]